jgi:hypothetical protein
MLVIDGPMVSDTIKETSHSMFGAVQLLSHFFIRVIPIIPYITLYQMEGLRFAMAAKMVSMMC